MQAQTSSRSKGRIALIAGGVALGLVALTVAAAGGTGVWAATSEKDSHGFVSTGKHAFRSPARAITTEGVDLHTGIPQWLIGKIRIEARAGSEPVFVGIARTGDVDAYLAGVDRAVVTDVGLDPFRVHYSRHAGTRTPGPPGSQRFWVASMQGGGTRSLTWETRSGSWSVVAMNADGSQGVRADIGAGASFPHALSIAIGVTVVGLLLLAGAALMLRSGFRRRPRPPAVAAVPLPQ
jgi:hypothetical protein